MNQEFVLLTEKEEMWAKMLVEVLEDHKIPCTTQSLYGVGFVLRTGTQDRLQVLVPSDCLQQAKDLEEELFSEESICKDEQIF